MLRHVFTNNASTVTTGIVNPGDLVIPVANGMVFNLPGAGEKAFVTLQSVSNSNIWEVVELVSATANDITVVRAAEGSAQTFPADSFVEQRISKGTLDNLLQRADVTYSDTPPVNPRDGIRWVETTTSREFYRYNDGTTTQWVELGPQIYGTDPIPAPPVTAYDLVQDQAITDGDIVSAALVGDDLILTKGDSSTISVDVSSLGGDGVVTAVSFVNPTLTITVTGPAGVTNFPANLNALRAGTITNAYITGNVLYIVVRTGVGAGTSTYALTLPTSGTADGVVTGGVFSDASKIITLSRSAGLPDVPISITALTLDAAKIVSGLLSVDRIPGLPASKITSGTFGNSRIGVDAIQTANILNLAVTDAKIATVAGSKITGTGTINGDKLIDASVSNDKLAGGITNAKLATGIDAAKVTVGTLPTSVLPNHNYGTMNCASGVYVVGGSSPSFADLTVPKQGNTQDSGSDWTITYLGSAGSYRITHGIGHLRYLPLFVVESASADARGVVITARNTTTLDFKVVNTANSAGATNNFYCTILHDQV